MSLHLLLLIKSSWVLLLHEPSGHEASQLKVAGMHLARLQFLGKMGGRNAVLHEEASVPETTALSVCCEAKLFIKACHEPFPWQDEIHVGC